MTSDFIKRFGHIKYYTAYYAKYGSYVHDMVVLATLFEELKND